MDESKVNTDGTDSADFGLVQVAVDNRLPDRGPRYKETPPDPYAANAPFIAEPFNAVTATLFIWIVVYWLIRLRGRYMKFPFLSFTLPILLVGGIGGTLYHAFRTRPLYFYMDVVPISVLGIAGSAFLAINIWNKKGYLYLIFAFLGYIGFSSFFFTVLAPVFPGMRTLGVNVTYAALAVILIIPLAIALHKTRYRRWGLVVAALASFAIAWFCRLVDNNSVYLDLPMGSHWLWHSFGALTTLCLVEYFYTVEASANP